MPIFVNEYIYESIRRQSEWEIDLCHHSQQEFCLHWPNSRHVSFQLSGPTPFGVGVRFRSHDEWVELFKDAGFSTEAVRIGADEDIKLPLRLLLIKAIRRDSFMLRTSTQQIA